MSHTTFTLIAIFLFGTTQAQIAGQKFCGNDLQGKSYYSESVESLIKSYMVTTLAKSTSDEQYIIPTVFHILSTDNDELVAQQDVLDQIEELNNAFNGSIGNLPYIPNEFKQLLGDMNIKFCLANTDPNGVPTEGIVRVNSTSSQLPSDSAVFFSAMGGADAWDTEKYLNIWVVDLGDHLLGYSIYPWDRTKFIDGVVINTKCFGKNGAHYKYNEGRTLVHEVGHYLGLFHLWDNDGCGSENDFVSDTPPQYQSYYGKPTYPQYSCGTSNMFMNYMDYVDDEMLLMFIYNQVDRVKACVDLYRPGLSGNSSSICSIIEDGHISFSLFPNPTSNIANVEYPYQPYNVVNVYIYDIAGRLIFIDEISESNRSIDLSLSTIRSGIYFIKIGNVTRKVIKY